jgi:SPP1 gp7 family putative phage head morphogenesis protein
MSWDWRDTWKKNNNRAFTVAKVMREDILKDIKDMVDKAVNEGITIDQFKKELTPKLQVKGWWGKQVIDGKEVQLGSPWRLKTIYSTNLNVGYAVGRYQELESAKEFAPYWQYVAVMDDRTRPEHALHHLKVYKADDPIWNIIYPPNGFNCRCSIRNYTQEQLDSKKLSAESSKGRITYKIDSTGNKSIKVPMLDGKKMVDPGWDYNPGKEYLKVKE